MRKKSIGQLKKDLWKVFSEYVRKRDNFTCFTCGRTGTGSQIHAGHFISKSVGGLSLYFHEENVKAQCYHCNINLGGNSYIFGERLGEKKAHALYRLKGQITKWNEEDYRQKIGEYQEKLEELKYVL